MRREIALPFSVHQRWLILFALWSLLLTGVFSNFIGSPGIIQAQRLSNLLSLKMNHLNQTRDELQKLQSESQLLETNRFTQEKEIRRVLGYAAPDELIFDFIGE
jgi:hypothetical protein